MISRTSSKEPASPVANICIPALPSAVASAGPASNFRPVASAVN